MIGRVCLLLEARAAMDAADELGSRPLHVALRNGHDAIARRLCELGANVDLPDYSGHTPRMVVTSQLDEAHSREQVASAGQSSQRELGGKADVDLLDHNGETPRRLVTCSGDEITFSHQQVTSGDRSSQAELGGRSCSWRKARGLSSRGGHDAIGIRSGDGSWANASKRLDTSEGGIPMATSPSAKRQLFDVVVM